MRTKAKHTPGPWLVEGDTVVRRFAENHQTVVARVNSHTPGWPDLGMPEIRKANAELIAAAPMLAHACRFAFRFLLQNPPPIRRDQDDDYYDKAIGVLTDALHAAGLSEGRYL